MGRARRLGLRSCIRMRMVGDWRRAPAVPGIRIAAGFAMIEALSATAIPERYAIAICRSLPMADLKEARAPDIGHAGVPVIEVLVKAGDRVEKEQSLITLESDKATMEV